MNGWHLTWTKFLAVLAWPFVAFVLTLSLIMTAVVAPREERDARLP